MRKTFFSSVIFILLFSTNSYSQNNPRLENTNYAQTKLFDDFNSLNRTTWKVHNGEYFIPPSKRNLLIWLDSIATVSVNQNSGNLALSMLQYPNYRMKNYLQETITANFISGQVTSLDSYTYGIFECSATFSDQLGAFPAFWTHSEMPCSSSFNNEIDIVEKKIDHLNPTLDNHIFYYPSNCIEGAYGYEFNPYVFNWGGAHTFKCIWTPTYIKYFVDDFLTKVVQNTGDYRYPTLREHVKLSQQIIEVNDNAPYFGVVTPQTSYFHWVKVREFFLAPQIACSPHICTSSTATLDVDLLATNINWTITPSNLFSGATTGTGKNVNIVRANGASGAANITYTFQMPSGESFSKDFDFWVGNPDYYFQVTRPDGYPVTNDEYGNLSFCPNTDYEIYLRPNDFVPCYASDHVWTIPSTWTTNYNNGNTISINTNEDPYNFIAVDAKSCCFEDFYLSQYFEYSTSCAQYSLLFTPNPSSGETTLSIVSKTNAKVDQLIEWDLEIYDTMQSLKAKVQKIKGDRRTINTSLWKDGIYLVKVRIGKEVIGSKLSVKH